MQATSLCIGLLAIATHTAAAPFDEQTLDQIDALNRAITEHYDELQMTADDVETRREQTRIKLSAVQEDLVEIQREVAELDPGSSGDAARRVLEEHRVEAKSRYLEALAERHAIDLEATRSFEVHGSAILVNLEKLARTLEHSGRLDAGASDEQAHAALASLQQGTAVALSVLEQWGTLARDDPRFRALWATSKVLNRNIQRVSASSGVSATVELVDERIFVVRSLIDQARALRGALDQQGLLLQVAAQNQMLRLHFNRLGAINGLELPDLDIEDTTRRILEDIEEEPFDASSSAFAEGLAGFDECAERGVCY